VVRHSPLADRETEVARLTRERDEALLRETANSEILRLISKSPGDLDLVFRTILEDATRICNAKFGNLFRFDGENLYPGISQPMKSRYYHVKVQAPGSRLLTTQLYFPNEPANRRDGLFRHELLMRGADVGDDFTGRFDFVLDVR
jgi:hypothetical protein